MRKYYEYILIIATAIATGLAERPFIMELVQQMVMAAMAVGISIYPGCSSIKMRNRPGSYPMSLSH